MTKKFHKTFGQVTVIAQDDTFTTILTASGEEKKLMTQFTKLSDTPVEPLVLDVIKPKKQKKYASYNSSRIVSADEQYAFELRMEAKKFNQDIININQ